MVVLGIIIAFGGYLIHSQGPPKKDSNFFLKVNGVEIKREDYQTLFAQQQNFHKWNGENILDASISAQIKKESLDSLIERSIMEQYAQKEGINVSDDELLDHYNKASSSFGTENLYLAKIAQIYGIDKSQLLYKMRGDILKQKIETKVGLPIESWLKNQKQKTKIETGDRYKEI